MRIIKLFENFVAQKKPIDINSIEELTTLLQQNNIPLEKWGTEGFKTISKQFLKMVE
jgi:hypothetical protein